VKTVGIMIMRAIPKIMPPAMNSPVFEVIDANDL